MIKEKGRTFKPEYGSHGKTSHGISGLKERPHGLLISENLTIHRGTERALDLCFNPGMILTSGVFGANLFLLCYTA